MMILQRLEYIVENLLHSDDAVAICQLEGEKLKDLIFDVLESGWGFVVVAATSGEHFLIFAASAFHQGNLVGDVRRWTRQLGYQFFVKLSDQKFPTPRPNVFLLPDGRQVEIQNVLTRASNFTHWALSERASLPKGYVRL
jgi:hypothetical protein